MGTTSGSEVLARIARILSRSPSGTPTFSRFSSVSAGTTSIPIALEIQNRFTDREELDALGDIQIKISGCMNACGHHHIGHIGILGVDKKGEEWFQITLGGRADQNLKIGQRLGPAVDRNSITNVVELIIRHYLQQRLERGEDFLSMLERVGIESFKEVVYG